MRGIPPLVIEKMLPFVTVFSNMASINVLDAAPQVLAALPGMTPEKLQAVLAQRGDPNGRSAVVLSDSGRRGGDACGLEGLPDHGRRRAAGSGSRNAAEVVILLLDSGDEPYRVLSWRNVSDGATRRKRPPCDEVFCRPSARSSAHGRRASPRPSIAGLDRMVSPRVVRLIEEDDGGFAVEAPAQGGQCPVARSRFADGALSAPNLAPIVPRQPGRDRAAAEALPVPSAGAAGARGRFHRGHRARADRPADAVERERGRVRLQRRRSPAAARASPR